MYVPCCERLEISLVAGSGCIAAYLGRIGRGHTGFEIKTFVRADYGTV